MKKISAFVVASAFMVAACVPSLHYRLGQGFYSEEFAKIQVQTAAAAGKVKNLGRFSTDYFACFNYSQDQTDRNVIIPAIQEKLRDLKANVADNVVANQPWWSFVDIVLFPIACIHYTVSGEALFVEKSALSELLNLTWRDTLEPIIFFKSSDQSEGRKKS